AVASEWPHRRRAGAEPLRGVAQGFVALRTLRLPHDSNAHHPPRPPALSLLRLLEFPQKRPATLPVAVDPGTRGRALRGRADPGYFPGSGRPGAVRPVGAAPR